MNEEIAKWKSISKGADICTNDYKLLTDALLRFELPEEGK